jgi:hypothetical protein
MTIEQYPSSNNIASTVIWKYTGQGTETVLSGTDSFGQVLNFTPGSEQLFLNGVLLVRTQDYTPAANGLSITLPSQLAYGDFVQIYCYSNYSISTVASSAITGAVQNTQLANSTITIGNQAIGLGQSITIPTGLTLSGSTNTFSNIPNSGLTNSSIIINGTAISLGGTVNITTPNTILSQKGGLIVGTGGGSVSQLTVGADGTSAISDSSQTTNIAWAGPTNITGKNFVLNGNFESWQARGSIASTPIYMFAGQYTGSDRWSPQQYQNAKVSKVSITTGSGPSSRYALRSQSSTVSEASGGTRMSVAQRIDSYIAQNLRGKTVTLSYWVRFSNATWTSVANAADSSYANFYGQLGWNTSTTDGPHGTTGWDGGPQNSLSNGSYPTNWTKYTVTGTIPNNTNNIIVLFQTGTLGSTTTDGQYWFELADVQLEVGSFATAFVPSGGNSQGDIALSGSSQFDGVLVATGSSTYPSGSGQLGWSGYNVAGKNVLVNGSQEFWQRGTTISSNGTFANSFASDHWMVYRGGGLNTATATRVATDMQQFKYAARVQRNSGDTGVGYVGFWQSVETLEAARFAGQPATLSFYARAGANLSSPSNGLTANIYSGTGTDQAWYSATGSTVVATQTVTLTSTGGIVNGWQRYTITGLVPSNANELGVTFVYTPAAGTAGANDWFEITGIQLEVGSTATTFSRSAGNYQNELLLCQRYFISLPYNNNVSRTNQYADFLIMNAVDQTTWARGVYYPPVTMRTVPTFEVTPTAANYYLLSSAGVLSVTSISLDSETTASSVVINAYRAVTAGATYFLRFAANQTDSLKLSAEIV